jgi:hypothetical protein
VSVGLASEMANTMAGLPALDSRKSEGALLVPSGATERRHARYIAFKTHLRASGLCQIVAQGWLTKSVAHLADKSAVLISKQMCHSFD